MLLVQRRAAVMIDVEDAALGSWVSPDEDHG